jgi:O-antigen/teichoic acid export membrane protein
VLLSSASASARIFTVITLLLTAGVTARRFTAEEFGLWSILLSLMFLMLIFDFGFRYGLGNRLAALTAHSRAGQDVESQRTFVSVFNLLLLVAILGTLLCSVVLPHVPWNRLFHIRQPDLVRQTPWVMTGAVILLFLYIPFSLPGTIFFAHQEIGLASALSAAQALALLGVLAVATWTLPFRWAVLAYFAAYVFTGLALHALVIRRRQWSGVSIPWREQLGIIRSISQPSLQFFVLCLSAAITATAGTFLSGAVAGLKDAGSYALMQKMFNALATLHLAILAPLAPVYTQGGQKGAWGEVRLKFNFTVRVLWPLMLIGCGLAIFTFHPVLIRLWAGFWFRDYWLAVLLFSGVVASGWTNSYSVLLNSLGLVRFQGIYSLIMVVPALALPLLLGRTLGIHGVALAALLCALPAIVIWPILVNRAFTRKSLYV